VDSTRPSAARWGKNYVPNVPLVSHEGETLRFFDNPIKDKIVVIDFVYTHRPDACPLTTARLARADRPRAAPVHRAQPGADQILAVACRIDR